MDLDVGEFLDSLQLNNLKDVFEKEQASRMKGLENTFFKKTKYIRRGGSLCRDLADSLHVLPRQESPRQSEPAWNPRVWPQTQNPQGS